MKDIFNEKHLYYYYFTIINRLEKYLKTNDTEKLNIKLGNIYLQTEDYMKALDYFQKALQYVFTIL